MSQPVTGPRTYRSRRTPPPDPGDPGTEKVNGKGAVFVRVCRSAKRVHGAICDTETTGRATRGQGGVYIFKPRAYRFPSYFANRPGHYYWQAVRIACSGGDCRQEGPVTRFTVR